MYPFVVHIERSNLARADASIKDARGRDSFMHIYQSYDKISIDSDVQVEGVTVKQETFYLDTKEKADLLAAKFAQEVPGRAVYVLELKSITQCTANPPVVSLYTEKGLVPK